MNDTKNISFKTVAGVEYTLKAVPMPLMPSDNPKHWLRFLGPHLTGSVMDEETQTRIQRFMKNNGTEALTDGDLNYTIAGGLLAHCYPFADENEPVLYPFRVSLHEEPGDQFQLMFDCRAEDKDHAEEQAENAYPGCVILSATRLDLL